MPTLILLIFLSLCHISWAEEPKRLLILDSQSGKPYDEVRKALLETLASYGYVEGNNLQIDLEVTGNDVQRGISILHQHLSQHYDAFFVGGTVATIAAKQVLFQHPKYPVVFGSPTDPVGIGVIQAFDQPPMANFTGVSYPVPVKARFRFIKKLLPQAKTFGLIYADMPQSHSYNAWVEDLLANDPEFSGMQIIFKKVALITGEHGDIQMSQAAIPIIQELNSQVDAFIKSNDQMGTRQYFSQIAYQYATKPLIGIVKDDVMERWGATAVIYPSHKSIGKQAATMIKALFEGKSIAEIPPEWPKHYGFAVDLSKTKQFNMTVPLELLLLAGKNIIHESPK